MLSERKRKRVICGQHYLICLFRTPATCTKLFTDLRICNTSNVNQGFDTYVSSCCCSLTSHKNIFKQTGNQIIALHYNSLDSRLDRKCRWGNTLSYGLQYYSQFNRGSLIVLTLLQGLLMTHLPRIQLLGLDWLFERNVPVAISIFEALLPCRPHRQDRL